VSDEKPVTLHATCAPPLREPGGKRGGYEYERRGTGQCFSVRRAEGGRHFTFPTPDRSALEFAQVAYHLAMQYPEAKTIHLVMDNLNIHRAQSLTDVFGVELELRSGHQFTVSLHTTPTEAGINQAEIEIGIFSRQCLGTRRIPDLRRCAEKPGMESPA